MITRQTFIRAALTLPMGLAWLEATAADNHDHGSPFTKLSTPQPVDGKGKIVVIEFFWYGCPHCKQLEPMLEGWESRLPPDVTLRREHIVWDGRPVTASEARFFATLRTMGLVAQHQRAVFEWVQGSRADLSDEKKLITWIEQRGINRAQFDSTYKSFGINSQVSRAKQLTTAYRVESVPSLVVNGKFATSPHQAGGERQMFEIIDRLIAAERGAKP